MPTQTAATIIRMFLAVLFAGSLSAALPATPCRGSDGASADPSITLNVQNEPLRSVLERISKATRWKIMAPDKWMDRPITQTLHAVSLEEGLRYVLKDAGVENLLLTYNENSRTITVYDTEIRPGQPANRPAPQGGARPPAVSANSQSDPMLTRRTNDAGSGPVRKPSRTRGKSRRQAAHMDEE